MYDKVRNSDGISYSLKLKDKITIAYKNIDNRTWKTNYRGRVYVHAGSRVDNEAQLFLMQMGFAPMTVLLLCSNRIPKGAIIGEIDIVDCVTESKSPWFTGPYGFVLKNPIAYDKPIPYKGQLGFFDVKI